MAELKEIMSENMLWSDLLQIPYASANPKTYQTSLSFDAFELLSRMHLYFEDLKSQVASPKLTRLGRDKIKRALASYQRHLELMKAHLEPLGHDRISFSEHRAYSKRHRVGHRLIDYYINIARDWAWGEDEIKTALAIIQKMAVSSKVQVSSLKRVLVLGAGACRLPYELHRWLRPELTVCLDLNPLLLSIAQKLVSGTAVEHFDFPNMPKDIDSYIIHYQLSAPEKLGSEFQFLVHDLQEWGLRPNTFDLILTPWVIDVAPNPPPLFFAQINSALRTGGWWLNHGPLNFSNPRLADNWTLQEILARVKKSGFSLENQDYTRVPYLQNPHSAHGRLDYALTFWAQKISDCEISSDSKREIVPDWITDTSLPVELAVPLDKLQASHHFAYDLSIRLGKGLSVSELAAFLSVQHGLEFDSALVLVQNTLLGWLTASRHDPMR